MPRGVYQRKPRKTRAPKRVAMRGGLGLARRRAMFNPQPIFTETYKATQLVASPGAGFVLSANIGNITQLAQYSSLYTKYKILKCTFILMPKFSGGSDQNNAQWNDSQGTAGLATTRVIYAISDSPGAAGPASEADMLQENGCKIRHMKNSMAITCSPVPDVEDANGVVMTLGKKFINFTTGGIPNVYHYGVRGWLSQSWTNAPTIRNDIDVYVKLTFQLSDPR